MAEYKYVLKRLGVRRALIGNVVNLLREEAELIDVSVTTEISPDPADKAFCACAEIGNASSKKHAQNGRRVKRPPKGLRSGSPLMVARIRALCAFIVTLNPKDFPQERIRAKVIAPGTPVPSTASRRLVKPKKV